MLDLGTLPDWTLLAAALISVGIAVRANGIAKRARNDSHRSADAAERSAVAAEQSADTANAIADVERRRLELDLTPDFELMCHGDATGRLTSRGPQRYDQVHVRLVDYGDDRPVRGFERDMITPDFYMRDVAVNHTEELRFARGAEGGGRVRMRLTCHVEAEPERVAHVEADLPAEHSPHLW